MFDATKTHSLLFQSILTCSKLCPPCSSSSLFSILSTIEEEEGTKRRTSIMTGCYKAYAVIVSGGNKGKIAGGGWFWHLPQSLGHHFHTSLSLTLMFFLTRRVKTLLYSTEKHICFLFALSLFIIPRTHTVLMEILT